MRMLRYVRVGIAICLALGCIHAYAGGPVKHQLASREEFNAKYMRSFPAKSSRVEVFWGCRKDLSPKYGTPEERIHIFDPQSMQVTPLVSDSITSQVKGMSGVEALAIDPTGEHVAALPLFLPKSNAALMCTKIILINVDTMVARCLIDDGQRNYAPSFSPDGRRLAYYATDSAMDVDPSKLIPHSAGRVVNLETGSVKTYTASFLDKGQWVFRAPCWLDENRVLFCTLSSDKALIKAYLPTMEISTCPYAAVANTSNDSVAMVFFPPKSKHCLPPRAFVDAQKRKVYLADESVAIQTDFDLTDRSVVVEAEQSKVLLPIGLKNGEFDFKMRDKFPGEK